ncbi:MAG: ATP-NAD kinase family protein [Gemmatimonadota bacterium]|nr:MAG: ATP-NAD kinase family protein [Gemmatimonadota bacterium]
MKRLGLIVNPVAGMGGAVGLKGTDGPEAVIQAERLGAVPRAGQRAERALTALGPLEDSMTILTYGGAMGEAPAKACGLRPAVIGSGSTPRTNSEDTVSAARQMATEDVDLLLFAGGDGTARDIYDAVKTSVTTLGIPAGVKIHSAVFASSPAAAGRVAASVLTGEIKRVQEAEVMDINEDDYRRGILSAILYGYLRIPAARRLLQGGKAATSPDERAVQAAIAAALAEQMTNDRCYLVGPGTTCAALMELLGLDNSLLGVDMICAGRLIGKDMSERDILEKTADRRCHLILTPVGGQGFLLGRGNQQISPAVIRRVGKQNITIAATVEKLGSLGGRPLLVDTGDADTDSSLCGHYRVITGYRQTAVYRVSDSS